MPITDSGLSTIDGLTAPTVWGDPNAMITLSTSLVSLTEGYISALEAQAKQLTAPVINPSFPTITTPPAPLAATEPTLIDVTWTVPNEPGAFAGSLNIGNVLPGPFAVPAPTISFPTAPAAFTGVIPPSPPIDLNFTYPTPSVVLPQPPQLLTLDTVNFNVINVPTFTETVPILTIATPSIMTYREPGMYTSALLTDLQTSLDAAITTGTFVGLPPNIEQALFDRGYEREQVTAANAVADLDRMEKMGFAFPPGVYLDARIKIQTEMGYTLAGLSREIMTTQAKTILDNVVAARHDAVALESKFIDYANQIAQRSFEYAKYATEASIAIYNGQVEQYKASLEGYRVQAYVYETQIKGILAQVEVLKAQIEFEKTKADINTALVEQYKAEVDAALAIVQIYELQVKIIQTEAEVEKIKVDVFAQQIAAFTGQINAYTAEVEGYKALVSTQGVIETVYKDQVDAYAAEVNAGVAEANALIAVFDGQIKAYEAQLEGYKAAIQGMVGQAQAASLFNTAEAEVYKAASVAIASYNQVLTSQWQAVLNEQEKIAEVAVAAAKANGDLYIAAEGLSLDASKVGAQVAAQLGAAALGAIHWANNSSWAIQISDILSTSVSTSTSTNTNINENS